MIKIRGWSVSSLLDDHSSSVGRSVANSGASSSSILGTTNATTAATAIAESAARKKFSAKSRKKMDWLEKQRIRHQFLLEKMVSMNIVSPSTSPKHPKHKPKLGKFIYLLAFIAVIGGFLFGYDTGIVSAAMLYVPKNDDLKPMSNNWIGLIVSITPGMAGIGALLAGKATDVFGRRKMVILSTIIFTLGAIVCAIGISKWILLAGRILLGIAIGFASMIVPVYVGESSPAHIRGRLITSFQLMITFGLVAANIFAGGFSYIDPLNWGWRLMVGFAAIPSIIQFVGFLFLPESPRWLYENKSRKECEEVLSKIYNGDTEWIQFELAEIQMAHDQQKHDAAIYGSRNVFWRIVSTPHSNKCPASTQSCIIRGKLFDQQALEMSIIRFGSQLEQQRLGRRVLLLSSIIGVFIACLLLGGGFLLINRNSSAVQTNLYPYQNLFNTGNTEYAKCAKLSNCDFCTTDESCGFCAPDSKPGFCLPKDLQNPDMSSLTGPCAGHSNDASHQINNTKFEWRDEMCQNDKILTFLPILIMVLFLCAFAIGYAPLPWVLNAEFYPLWARGTCVALSTFCNWEFNLLVSLTFLPLNQAVTRFGTFFIYAGVTAIAFVIFYFVVPETKGLNLDEIQLLFMTKRERKRAVTSLKMKQLSGVDLSTVTR
uniref:Major facilitator superfamily (MFS) profile domain-containing protein n=1 Tax=Globodera rostochiensis TaxID=31243 RepID=A0A914I114_GLORO